MDCGGGIAGKKGKCWYKLKLEQRMIIETDKVKLCWEFDYWMRNKTVQRPGVMIEYK